MSLSLGGRLNLEVLADYLTLKKNEKGQLSREEKNQ